MPTLDTQENLRETYGKMQRLDDLTPQTRGQQFNGWLADLLRAHGIDAKANQRSVGEIDVVFTIGDTRYILEAKWSKAKTDTGQLAKLQKRVRQRLNGTYGVFVSMAGYTEEALTDLVQGDRLELILVDREHVEAMLSGEFSPQLLFSKLRDEASFTGRTHTSMAALRRTAEGEVPRAFPLAGAHIEPSQQLSDNPTSWDPQQRQRGNPADQYLAFDGHQRSYWVLVALLLLLALITAASFIGGSGPWRVAAAMLLAFEIGLVVGFWRMAMRPLRLEIGVAGIQSFFPKTSAWMPWDLIDRVNISRVNGNLAVVVWSKYADVYPTAGEHGQGAHYVPSYDAVAICPLGPLRAKRHHIVRALQRYSANRY